MHHRKQPRQTNRHQEAVNDFRAIVLQCIHQAVDLSRFETIDAHTTDDLARLTDTKHFVVPHFSGSHTLLACFTIRGRYHKWLIDHASAMPSRNGVANNDLKMTNVTLKLNHEVFRDAGTIFDGVCTFCNGQRTFVITDVYRFCGNDHTETAIDTKMQLVYAYLESNYDRDDIENTIELHMPRPQPLDQFEMLVYRGIPQMMKSASSPTIEGVCFYPVVSGTRIMFKYNPSSEQVVLRTPPPQPITRVTDLRGGEWVSRPKAQPHIKNVQSSTKYGPLPANIDETHVFEMRRARDDEECKYKLYAVQSETRDDGKVHYKRVRIGCVITDDSTDAWCDAALNQSSKSGVLVECTFDRLTMTWKVTTQSHAKQPIDISELMNISH